MTSGMQSGDDFVAFRVNMDIPTEGLSSIKELSQAMERMRAVAEAGAKTNQSYVGYLQQMAQAAKAAAEAHVQLEQQLQRNADLQQRVMGGLGNGMNTASALPLSRAVPQGYTDNFAGMGIGMGGARSSPSDVPSQLQANQMVQGAYGANPQMYVNAQAGRFRTAPGMPTTATGAPDWQAQASQVQMRDQAQQRQAMETPDGSNAVRQNLGSGYSGGGLAHNIMNEMAVGGSVQGMLGMGHRLMGALGSRGQPLGNPAAQAAASGGGGGGALSGLFSGGGPLGMLGRLGPAGMIAGAGLAGLGLVERGGGIYQDYKNMGLITGEGAGKGAQDEAAIRTLALNPFISNEQARQVIMAGLTEGYKGKSFETVTQFMTQNLKDMNMSVAESVGVLRKNIIEGGATPEGTQSTLGLLKEMSKTGALSLPDRKAAWEQLSGAMVSSGVPGDVANKAAAQLGGVFDDDEAMKLKMSDFAQATTGSPLGGNMEEMYSGVRVPGLNPEMLDAWQGANGGDVAGTKMKAAQGMVRSLFPRGFNPHNKGDMNKIPMLRRRLSALGLDWTNTQVMQWVQKLSGPNPFEGQDKLQQVSTQITGGESIASDIGQGAGSIGDTMLGLGKAAIDAIHGDFGGADRAMEQANKVFDQADYNMGADAHTPLLDSLVGQYGPSNIEVIDGQGKASALSGSHDQVQGLVNGSLKWRRKGEQGGGVPLSAVSSQGSNVRDQGGGNSNVGVNFSPATVNIRFENNGATASPNPVQLTPNQQAVNSGYGNATMNNPPPGDGYGYYRGRMANGMS